MNPKEYGIDMTLDCCRTSIAANVNEDKSSIEILPSRLSQRLSQSILTKKERKKKKKKNQKQDP